MLKRQKQEDQKFEASLRYTLKKYGTTMKMDKKNGKVRSLGGLEQNNVFRT